MTHNQLRTKCQEIANLTGCIVTVDKRRVFTWSCTYGKSEIYYNEFYNHWELKYEVLNSENNAALQKILYTDIIPDPENWIFEPEDQE